MLCTYEHQLNMDEKRNLHSAIRSNAKHVFSFTIKLQLSFLASRVCLCVHEEGSKLWGCCEHAVLRSNKL